MFGGLFVLLYHYCVKCFFLLTDLFNASASKYSETEIFQLPIIAVQSSPRYKNWDIIGNFENLLIFQFCVFL